MVNALELLDYFRKYPVFSTATVRNKAGKGGNYTNLLLHRLIRRGIIRRIERDKYTAFDDPFLIASRIVWPSYISCWSALKYHNLTEQVPQDITVMAATDRKAIRFGSTNIRFIRLSPKSFFGYEKTKYEGFDIFVADAEKAVIDSALLHRVSFSELKDLITSHMEEINAERLLRHLKKTGNKSLIKRFGYLLETLGKDYHSALKRYIDAAYIPLDYSRKPTGNRNAKWKVVVNA